MSIITIIYIINIVLWLIFATSTLYVFIFALASLLPRRQLSKASDKTESAHYSTFLVLFPAYNEDTVIINSVLSFLKQDYPATHYNVVVISDNMLHKTNDSLASLPITLLQPSFDNSSKAKALQYAIDNTEASDFVVVLDADNIVSTDFLSKLNKSCRINEAIQCHRTAKNTDNNIAALDGISEEINNSIFRKGHNRIGMSSALIGSGMCFSYEWFKANVTLLNSAVEDRELEALLLKQNVFIRYEEDLYVMDEKVSSNDNFQRQRLRWMTGQLQSLFSMLPYLPKAIITANINYIDKTLQQALIPRSILLVLTFFFAVISTLVVIIQQSINPMLCILWWMLLFVLAIAIFVAIPLELRNRALINKVLVLPQLTARMLLNILHIRPQNKEFIHTSHDK